MAGDRVEATPTPPESITPSEPAIHADEPRELVMRRPAAARSEPHGWRFRVAYALLAVVLGAGVGAFIVLVGRDSGSDGSWSSWQPDGSDFEKTRQIASAVGSQYRLPSGQQLVAVIPRVPPAVAPSTQETPIAHVALAESSSPEDIEVYSTENSVEYVLCGLGAPNGRCAIGEGQPSLERARLLHRESLELALYTFKYVEGVDSVIALQPPRRGQDPTLALFFRKDDLKDALKRPLSQTLAGNGPFTTQGFTIRQQVQVARLVSPHIFRFTYQQAPDLSAVMVLQPLPA